MEINKLTMNLTLKKWFIVAPTVILFFFGCGGNINIQDIDKESRPPNTGDLDIYNSAEEVKRPYKTTKILRGEHYLLPSRDDDEEMKRKVFAEAKKFGADGSIIKKTGMQNVRVPDGMGGSVPYKFFYIEIEAIVYLDK